MAVLVEAISVIVRRDAIACIVPGGWAAFVRLVPNATLCHDETLARVGFMTPTDVAVFVDGLELRGLCFQRSGRAVDIAVVDQERGLTVPAPWLTFDHIETDQMHVAACWLAGQPRGRLVVPQGWSYSKSLSWRGTTTDWTEAGQRLKYLRNENGLDVYFDSLTNREVFVGRTSDGADTSMVHARLTAICKEAVGIDEALRPLLLAQEEAATVPYYHRLNDDLYPEVRRIACGPSHAEDAFAQFTLGLVLRILDQRDEAETALRRANLLMPGVINTLLELVRCLGEQNKHKEALPFAREAVQVAPNDPAALGNLAMCLSQSGLHEVAERTIEQALKLDPDNSINGIIRDSIRRRAINR